MNFDQEPATRPLNPPTNQAQTMPPVENPKPVKPPKKRRNAWSTVAFVFLILFILASLVAGFFWYMWQETKSTLISAEDTIASQFNDKSALQKENTELTNRLAGLESAASLSAGNDEEQIKKTAEQFNLALAEPLESPAVTLTKRDTTQAIATVASSEDSYLVYLKQINGRWTAVWSGEAAPSDETRQQYGLTIE